MAEGEDVWVHATEDQEDVVADVKRRRGIAKGLLTRQMGIIDKMTTDDTNVDKVREKLETLAEYLENFKVIHAELMSVLIDDDQCKEAKEYNDVIISEVMSFHNGLQYWMNEHENGNVETEEVTVDRRDFVNDEVSDAQLEAENSKIEEEIRELSNRQKIELRNRELSLMKEKKVNELQKMKLESELILRREKVKMLDEQRKLQEELDAYQAQERRLETERYGSTTDRTTPGRLEATSREQHTISTPKMPPKKPSRVSWEPSRIPPIPEEPEQRAASALVDALNQVLDMSRVHQQSIVESLQVPRGELQSFNGDELEYWPFIRTFKDTIDCLAVPAAQKLACLRKYCTGKAALALKSTSYKNPEDGYQAALKILEERYGNTHNITCEWVKKVTNRPEVKGTSELREYADELSCCVESLKEMNSLHQLGSGDNMLKIVRKLPFYLQTRWVKVNHDIRLRLKRGANITELVKFICDSADEASDPVFGVLVTKDSKKNRDKNVASQAQKKHTGSFATNATLTENKTSVFEKRNQTGGQCPCCGQGHYIIRCPQFKGMKIKDRWSFVISKGLCVNCFAYGHIGKNCGRTFTCNIDGCGMKHSRYLHMPIKKSDATESARETTSFTFTPSTPNFIPQNSVAPTQAFTSQVPSTQLSTFTPTLQNPVLDSRTSLFACSQGGKLALPIVPARVRCPQTSAYVDTYALLDPATNSTYCTEELCMKLGARGVRHQMELTTLTDKRMPVETSVVTLLVCDLEDKLEPFCIPECTVRSSLNIDLSNRTNSVEIQRWPHLKELEIPDLQVEEVHLLIGQDCSDLFLPDGVKKGNRGEPFAVHTPLGWAINGPVDPFRQTVKTSHFVHNSSSLERDLCKLWDLEGANSEVAGMSQSDLKVMRIWDQSKTLENSHYVLDIPFKAEIPCLPDNRTMAEKRLQSLGKRLDKDEDLKERYTTEIRKLLKNGYAEEVTKEDMNRADGKVFYLPHHPVHNPKKPEKTRIVFDCAAKYCGSSLNDHVHQGPDLANKLVGVLLRFREGAVAFIADIEAMYHQVKVTPDDRDALRFVWFQGDDTGGPSVTYRMTSHLFGGVWSPSCANYALQQLTKEFAEEFPQVVLDTVLHNFYIDDCLKSVKTLDIAVPLASEVRQLLAKRGFRLTKVFSNSPELMTTIPKEEWGKSFSAIDVSLDKLPTERALGMLWDISSDNFKYDIQLKDTPKTKRGLLSTLSTVYDPLGWVSPFILRAKLLFQQLCKLKKTWDEPLPRDIEDQWGRWLNDLPRMKKFTVPRCIMYETTPVMKLQLHHFCDASEYGYGAVSYLVTTFEDQSVSVHLMMAKSRLAPIKGSTIPRLELAGALEAVRLDRLLLEELKFSLDESIYWTDSTIVLWYLQSTEKRFQTYVSNRVAKILEHTTTSQWRYVPTADNPADDASRGMVAEDLVSSHRWKNGPGFLYEDEVTWPRQPVFNCAELESIAEVKRTQIVYALKMEEDYTNKLLRYYSSWHRLKKAVAWLLRLRNILSKKLHQKGPLVTGELKAAEEALIRHAQKSLSDAKKTSLDKLNPKVSSSGLILVGGRLTYSKQEESTKHQFILPPDHPISRLIVEDFHQKLGHAGVERVLADIRKRYWILGGRKLIKKIVHQCITCRRLRGKTEVQQMASLPESRVTPFEPPFTRVGVDYFGPFMVKRARSQVKRYGCIFTCLSTRAVHIEVAHTLDTNSFINALERFIARRGEPKELWSDNGTNFIGAQQELRRALQNWNQSQIYDHLLKKEITWKFNPPGASHMGGVWERQIRTIRAVLAGVVKQQTMDDEALVTLMTVVEGIVNGRPITKLSDDPRDERPLTPNHLLMLRSGPVMPLGKFESGDVYGRRWKQVQYLADVFWSRWLREYLPTLQERTKWMRKKPNLKIGDLVLMKQEKLPRNQWPLGLVVETYMGTDGLVRSVEVKTASGTYQRPITKICVLESAAIDSNQVVNVT